MVTEPIVVESDDIAAKVRPTRELAHLGGEHSEVMTVSDVGGAAPAIMALINDRERHATTEKAIEVFVGRKAIGWRLAEVKGRRLRDQLALVSIADYATAVDAVERHQHPSSFAHLVADDG